MRHSSAIGFGWRFLFGAGLAVAVLSTSRPAFAQSSGADATAIGETAARAARRLIAVRATGPIVIDGRLDEPDWQRAPLASDFTQSTPFEGQPPSERTEVRVLYDDQTLYIGVMAYQSDVSDMVVKQLKRDFDGAATDWVAVIVDPFHDRRNGYQFGANPAGAMWDSQKSNEGRDRNLSWDAVWFVRTQRTSEGWSAEFAVPFRSLQFPATSPQTWGINFERHLQRRQEDSYWAPVPRQYLIDRLSLAGTLERLDGIRPGANLQVKPYVLADRSQDAVGTSASTAQAGFDVKYGLTPSVRLDATVNTDFSQVEADEQQIAASRFGLLFPEKRAFFLENAGLFQFGPAGTRAQLVSGAAGTSADGRDNTVQNGLIPFFSRRIGLSDAGDQIPILGGGRLIGEFGSTTVGALNIQQRADGDIPAENFTAIRVRRNLAGGSDVGALVLNRSGGGTTNSVLGLDGNWRPSRDVNVDGYLIGSHSASSASTAAADVALRVGAEWRDGVWDWLGSYDSVGSRFVDDVGFVPRTGIHRAQLLVGRHFRPLLASAWLREITPELGVTDVRREGGGFDSRYWEYRLPVTFRNGAVFEAGANPNAELLSAPFVLSVARGIQINEGMYRFADEYVSFTSSSSSRVAVTARLSRGAFYDGQRQVYQAGVSGWANERLNGSVAAVFNNIELPTDRLRTRLITARVNFDVSTRMFVDAFLQYNTNTGQISTDVRLDLIHHPLSDLFVVLKDHRDSATGSAIDHALVVKFTQLFAF